MAWLNRWVWTDFVYFRLRQRKMYLILTEQLYLLTLSVLDLIVSMLTFEQTLFFK